MADLGFEDFQWDIESERHTGHRGLRPAIVHAVVTGKPKVYANKSGRRGTHMVIGPDRRERYWTLIMLRASNHRWRVITGWPSKASELSRYREET